MDPIKGEKLRAMKSYKKQNNSQIFYSLIVHLLIAIACCLLCSYSHWFPSLYTAKHLLFMSLPNSWSGFFNPRCLFIVVNFIVVFLIGESRLSGRQSSPANEMYNEYVERTRSLRAPTSMFQEKKEERTELPILSQKEDNAMILEEKEVDETKEDKHEVDQDEDFKECEGTDEEEKEEEKEKKEEEIEQEKKEEEEEAAGIPAEELNKRVEAFIARVNKQRSLEARFLVCSKA
ncbi:hypothetical protein L3X38_004779 [Prunus dulcis]|uniref:DUF4408 domain-containing protein n=1 Tax=Prunus dulcis TaxID=3755 RepID=A0AAD5F3L3_PRUDU|nr:hypothetical protein L3X38_004779 [Prunus dulcis]